MGIVSIDDAKEKAKAAGLDLVVVSDKSDPAVCKIMDFGKLQYEQKKNIKSQKKHSLTQKLKEVKFHVSIDKHDYEYKIKHCVEFLEKGYKLKASLIFRGREMAHKDMGYELVDKIIDDLSEYGTAENKPKLIGRSIIVSFAPLTKSKKK